LSELSDLTDFCQKRPPQLFLRKGRSCQKSVRFVRHGLLSSFYERGGVVRNLTSPSFPKKELKARICQISDKSVLSKKELRSPDLSDLTVLTDLTDLGRICQISDKSVLSKKELRRPDLSDLTVLTDLTDLGRICQI
jgi:hypothetical protein